MCVCVEDWSREKLNKLNIKEVFVNGITCTTMARKKEKKKKKKIICTTMASLLTALLAMGLAINHILKPKLMEFTFHFFHFFSLLTNISLLSFLWYLVL